MAARSDVLSEIEVLQSIYLDELTVSHRDDGGFTVSVLLHPSTGEDSLAQFVRLTLTMELDPKYPSSSPSISIQNPRGLSDDKLLSLKQSLQAEVESSAGMPVLYQLIEKAKEILTESNIPHGNCVICLYGFKDGEIFTKTSCYHYFHSHCLGRYITHSEEELKERVRELEKDKTRDDSDKEELSVVCPVCREPLVCDVDALLSSPVPNFPQEDAAVGSVFKKKWAELQKILERQKQKGGVIDPEAESNRFLIHINDVPSECADLPCSDAPITDSIQLPSSFPSECTPETPPPPPPRVQDHFHPRAPRNRRPRGEFRGRRRGRERLGGRNVQHSREIAEPVLDGLTKLSLCNIVCDEISGPRVEKPTGTAAGKSVPDVSDDTRDKSEPKPGLSVNTPGEAAQTDRQQERVHRERGRRHWPRGPPYAYWHERHSQWEHLGNGGQHRGGRGHRVRGGGGGGHHYRGSGKGLHQRTESEVRKEGVL